MTDFGYHASHEQFPPDALVEHVQRAERAGFTDVLASDHFHPWSERQGNAGHVWSWLGAAMQATDLTFGTVNAPGYRYHPAVVAQAAATLARMYPDRFWLSVGSGQLLNEHITGEKWPNKPDRNARLRECADVMRRLWDGETVTHRGHVTVEDATLYTRPERPPRLVGAARSPETAKWLGEWADGLVTVGAPDVDQLQRVAGAFRNKAPARPIYVKAQLAYAEDEDAALEAAHDQWRAASVPGAVTANLRTTGDFDEVGEDVTEEQVRQNVFVSADLDEHVAWLRELADVGVEKVFLHDVTREQEGFVEAFGEHVLPALGR